MSDGRWLIVCDIDGTLLLPEEDNPGLDEFNRFVEERRDRIIFALNSGRSLESMAEVAERGPIARPDWLITKVGTTLHSSFDPASDDGEWMRLMSRDWGRETIRGILKDEADLEEQEEFRQHPAKLSYYLNRPSDGLIPKLLRRLGKLADDVKLIVSHRSYLDIMPGFAGKGAPVDFLARRLGITRDHVVTAGDSGNDLDMLDRGFPSIVVSDHYGELDVLAGRESVYFASRPAADGVMEGLRHFGVE